MTVKASEIMSTPVKSIKSGTSLKEVIDLFNTMGISGVPVTNDANEVIGILSEKDIRSFCEENKIIATQISSWYTPQVGKIPLLEKSNRILAETPAEKVMKKKVITVKKDTSMIEVASLMKQHSINRLPVVDESNKLVGIITRDDLVHFFVEREKYLQ